MTTMAVKAVREVSPWSIGSGVRLRELIRLPEWLVVTGTILSVVFSLLIWLVVHYVITGIAVMFGLGWYQFGVWWAGIPCALLVPAAYWSVRVAIAARAGEAVGLWDVLRGMKRAHTLKGMWPSVMRQLKLTSRNDTDGVPPLVHLLPTPSGVTGTVVAGSIAMDSNKLVKLETELASGLFCDRVIVRPQTPSIASIRFDWGQHLRHTYRLHQLPPGPAASAEKPARIRFGVNADGTATTLVSNLSTLIGGAAGGGKSSTVWSILAGYMEQVPIRVRVVDPSGIEFAELAKVKGNGLVHDYVSDPSLPGARQMDEFWGDLEAAFNRRMHAVIQSGQRWHQPTPAEPLDITIIDELIPIAPQLRKDSTEHIVGRIAYLGRKAGFVVIALTQASQVDVIGRIRDLFPQRVSHRTPNRYITEAVLGDGAESDGGRASQLDIVHDQGVGYIAAEGVRGYMGFRSAWVSNADTKTIASNQRPIPAADTAALRQKPTSVYAFHNQQGDLLYVGIAEAGRVDDRWSEHQRSKKWWGEVARREVVDTFPDRDSAETAEALMIRRKKPRYNVQHNSDRVHVSSR